MSGPERIMLTRSRDDCAAWAAELATQGAEAIVFPCIDTELIAAAATRTSLARALERADWLVFTSARGVAAFVELYGHPMPGELKVATIGAASTAAARAALGRADLTGTGGTAATLAEELIAATDAAQHLLLVLAENAAATLELRLAAAGRGVSRVDVYRTIPKPELQPKRRFSTFAADWVFLASPSSSAGFVNQIELDCPPRIVTIGPTTSAAARRLGLASIREAPRPSLSGLMEAIHV